MALFGLTANYNFKLIDFDVATWHDDEYDNWRAVDALLAAFFALPGFTGVWVNSTTYTVGQLAVDSVSGKIYETLIEHTSVASPTLFSADRTANPTFWQIWLISHMGDTNNPHLTPTNNSVVINGNFDIWQRGTSFTAPFAGNYTADRWQWGTSGAGVVDIVKGVATPDPVDGLSDAYLEIDVTTVDTSLAASDFYLISYQVEGFDAVRFGLGTPDAIPITLAFVVQSSKTGIHCVSFRNSANDRSYIVEYTIASANVWERFTVTLTGDVLGTWLTTNGMGLTIGWALAAGADSLGAANTWNGANNIATSGQVNVMDDTANFFRLSRVQLEVGTVAAPFERRPFAIELALCQRYYAKSFQALTVPAENAGNQGSVAYRTFSAGSSSSGLQIKWPVTMRAIPDITFYNPGAANALWRNVSGPGDSGAASVTQTGDGGVFIGNAQAGGDVVNDLLAIHYQAEAEL